MNENRLKEARIAILGNCLAVGERKKSLVNVMRDNINGIEKLIANHNKTRYEINGGSIYDLLSSAFAYRGVKRKNGEKFSESTMKQTIQRIRKGDWYGKRR